MIPILTAVRHWSCPNCTFTDITRETSPHTRMHPCAGLRGGLTAPMVPAGTKCKVVAVERGDYVRGQLVQTDPSGRPVMAVRITRDDGEDCAILAPLAVAEGHAHE